MLKIKVTYANGTEDFFEGTVKLHPQGCFQIIKEIKQAPSALALVEEKTDSVYIPFDNILKLETLNGEA